MVPSNNKLFYRGALRLKYRPLLQCIFSPLCPRYQMSSLRLNRRATTERAKGAATLFFLSSAHSNRAGEHLRVCVCLSVCLSGTGWMDGWMEWDGRRRMTTASDGWMTPRRISAGESVPAKPPPASRTQKRDSAELKRRITLLLCCCK